MKRNLMIAVLLGWVLLACHSGITRASKHGPAELAAQGIGSQEISEAEIERSEAGLAIPPVPVSAGFGRT